jgi:nicotinate-nucleotide adenylyltransferase
MDNLIELHTWKDPDKLFMLSEVIVINRPGFYAQTLKMTIIDGYLCTVTNIDISATEIRSRIKENKTIKYLSLKK